MDPTTSPSLEKRILRLRAEAKPRAQVDPELEEENEEEKEEEVAAQEAEGAQAESQPPDAEGAPEEATPPPPEEDDLIEEEGLRKIEILAYSGGAMRVEFWNLPVVVDLSGLEIPTTALPIRANHDANCGIGHTTDVRIEGTNIVAEGVVSRGTEEAEEFLVSIDRGFPWRASVGLEVLEYEDVPEGVEVEVNGRVFSGPVTVVRLSVLREISVVDVPADLGTSVLAARAGKVCKLLAHRPDLAERAIAERWSLRKCQLVATRTRRPKGGTYAMPAESNSDILEICQVALALRAGGQVAKWLEKRTSARTIEAAERLRGLGFEKLARICLERAGQKFGIFSSTHDVIRAAFSVRAFPRILRESAYKILLATYESLEPTCMKVARIVDVANYQPHVLARLVARSQLEPVPNGGYVPLDVVTDEGYTLKADLYGRLFSISYQDLVNDDLGAFLQIPIEAARGAVLALENLFWDRVVNSGTFFSTTNGNLVTGAPLTVANLSRAVEAMQLQKDRFGQPIFVRPKYLVVPPGLKAIAESLFVSPTIVISGNADREYPAANIFAGQYEPVVTPYLPSNGSNSTWYLVSDPAVNPAFAIALRRDEPAPVLEEVEPDPRFLGFMLRVHWSFGAGLIDHRAAVRATA